MRLSTQDAPLQLDSPGNIVHIDESLFRLKVKVLASYKKNIS